jgi:hypothetical protein
MNPSRADGRYITCPVARSRLASFIEFAPLALYLQQQVPNGWVIRDEARLPRGRMHDA